MGKGKVVVVVLLFMGLAALVTERASGGPQSSESRAAPAQQSWQKEFEDVCSKTQDAMTFSEQELADLIRRCDVLQSEIEKLDESRKKVYSGRLRMCRGLYAYVLDAKRNDKK